MPTIDIHTANHWPIDIRIETEETDAVNVKSLLSNTLNSFQDKDSNTMMAPINYEDDPDPQKYIKKGYQLPSDEVLLKNYILRIKTQQDSILVSAIFVTHSYFYQLVEDNMKYYDEANMILRLNLLQADKTTVAGFFVDLLAKSEFLYEDYQCRIQELLGPNAPPFQVILFDLNFRQKGQRFPTVRSKVYAIQVLEEDLQEMVFMLKTACRYSALYHFIAWEEYTCLKDEQKQKIIEMQNLYSKNYISFRVGGFNHEPVGMTMYLGDPVEQLTSEMLDAGTKAQVFVEPSQTPKQRNSTNSVSTNSSPKVVVETVKDSWEDEDDELTITTPITNQVPTTASTDDCADGDSLATDQIMREPSTVPHTPPASQRADKPEKRQCTAKDTNLVPVSIVPHPHVKYHMTISDYLKTIRSGDGELLFISVSDRVNGAREIIGLTRKKREISSFIEVIHTELARQMNMSARQRMYPDQTIDNPKSFYNTPQWHGFELLASNYLQDTNAKSMLPHVAQPQNYEYQTDGKRYYNKTPASSMATVTTYGSKRQSISTDIVTLYPSGSNPAVKHQQMLQSILVSVSVHSLAHSDTMTNSTITSTPDDDINGLRAELTAMQFHQSRLTREITTLTQQADQSPTIYQSALERFENRIMEKTVQAIQAATSDLTADIDRKIDHKEQLVNNQFAVISQELETTRTTSNATLATIQEFMQSYKTQMDLQNQQLLAQQQQLQHQQQQNQEIQQQFLDAQKQNGIFHRTLVDRLTATDQTISLVQQSTSLQDTQLQLLASTKSVSAASTADGKVLVNTRVPPLGTTPSPLLTNTGNPSSHPTTNKPVAVTPSNASIRSTQTTITSTPDGTMQLSSNMASKTGGLSSRTTNKVATKDL